MVDIQAPIIILSRPQLGENIGFAARAMGNFGLDKLRLVSPRDGWPNPAALAASANASYIIEQAQVFDTLAAAVADCRLVLATTARRRDMLKPSYDQQTFITPIKQTTPSALLFGCEKDGLSNEEIGYAHGLIHFDCNPDLSSFNLGQAVLLLAQSWWLARDVDAPPALPHVPAPMASVNNFADRLIDTLDAKGFFRVPHKKPGMVQNIRTLLLRSQCSEQELRTLHGITRFLSRKSN